MSWLAHFGDLVGDRPKDRRPGVQEEVIAVKTFHLELFPDNEEADSTMPIHVQADKYILSCSRCL